MRAIEEILRSIGYFHHLVESARSARREAAGGIESLDISDTVKHARAITRDGLEEQPGNGARIRNAGRDLLSDDRAAAVAFPSWAGVMGRDFTMLACIGVEGCARSNESPSAPVPFVNLHSFGIGVELQSVAIRHLKRSASCRKIGRGSVI